MWAVVGLGNPGPAYAGTRHNAGAMALERLAREEGVVLERAHRLVCLGWWRPEGQEVLLVRPRTYMNESGQAVGYLQRRFQLPPSRFLVLYDDMDLPLGRLRLRPGGSAGGHRGMASVLQALGTASVPRLRIGIGRPPPGVDPVEFVLSPFTPEEWAVMEPALERAVSAVRAVVQEGLERAMDRFNRPSPPSP